MSKEFLRDPCYLVGYCDKDGWVKFYYSGAHLYQYCPKCGGALDIKSVQSQRSFNDVKFTKKPTKRRR